MKQAHGAAAHSAPSEWYATAEIRENMTLDERDLAELRDTVLTGLTVGIGSLVLLFASGAQVLVQCMFQCGEEDALRSGHGEDIRSSPLLLDLLNHRVEDAMINADWVLTLRLDDDRYLRIVPERNGLESYVVTTRHGICPIVVSNESELQ